MAIYKKDGETTDESFYRDLIINDVIDTDEKFEQECFEIIGVCNKYDLSNHLYRVDAIEMDDYQKIKPFFVNPGLYTSNKHIVEWISGLDAAYLENILDRIKIGRFGNFEEIRKMQFPRENIPILRIMKCCLENKHFEQYHSCAQKLEEEYVTMFVAIYYKQFADILDENKNNPDILYLFSNLKKEYVERLFSLEFLKTSDYEAVSNLIKQDNLSHSFFMSPEFIMRFQQFTFLEQIMLMELMEGLEYCPDFIAKLHQKLDKKSENNCKVGNTLFEISSTKFQYLYEAITNSSYFRKNHIENSSF